jgi:hypothetical protein
MRGRRLRRVLALAGLAVLLAAGAFVLWPRPPKATLAAFDRVQRSMTEAEVYALLGPPGDHRTGPTEDPFSGAPLASFFKPPRDQPEEPSSERLWQTDEADFRVWVGPNGVSTKSRTFTSKVYPGTLPNFLWRLERQWHRWFP